MEQNKIRTYLLYAIGEILLVVIGILIALQVNNRNEAQKTHETTLYLIEQAKDELYNNLVVAEHGYTIYQHIDSVFLAMKYEKPDAENYKGDNGFEFRRAIGGYSPFVLEHSDYINLINYVGLDQQRYGDIISELTGIYRRGLFIEQVLEKVQEINGEWYQYQQDNFAWRADIFWEDSTSQEAYEFMAGHPKHRSIMAQKYGAIAELLIRLDGYVNRGLSTYKYISNRLEEDPSDIPEMIRNYYVELPPDSLINYTGTYKADGRTYSRLSETERLTIDLNEYGAPFIIRYNGAEADTGTLKIRSASHLEEQISNTRVQYFFQSNGSLMVKDLRDWPSKYIRVNE